MDALQHNYLLGIIMRKTLISTAVAMACVPMFGMSTASAESEISANIGFVSDYRYRGISQTDRKAAVNGGFDYAHESGFYAGIWGSSISWLGTGAGVEIDVYGGYAGEVGDFTYDVGLLHYNYPGGKAPGATNPNTTEAYVSGGWGPFSLSYSHSFTNLFGVDKSKGSHYLMAAFEYELMENLTFDAHVGRQKIKGPNGGSYSDYSAGLTYAVAGFDIGLHYIDTSGRLVRGVDEAKGTALLSISRSF